MVAEMIARVQSAAGILWSEDASLRAARRCASAVMFLTHPGTRPREMTCRCFPRAELATLCGSQCSGRAPGNDAR